MSDSDKGDYHGLIQEARSYGALGREAALALELCESAPQSPQKLSESLARSLGALAGVCVALKAEAGLPWTLEHAACAPAAPQAMRLAYRGLSVALEGGQASPQERLGALGEMWARAARSALENCLPTLKYKTRHPKGAFAWLAQELMDEASARALAPAIAAAHLAALTGGWQIEGFALVRGWEAPLFRDQEAWGFHMAALEWSVEKSDRVELPEGLLGRALERHLTLLDCEGDEEAERPVRQRMERFKALLERAQISAASAPGRKGLGPGAPRI